MVGGVHAGEVRNLPFMAARGAIRSGLARALGEEIARPRPTTAPAPAAAVVAQRLASAIHEDLRGKRHGKRR